MSLLHSVNQWRETNQLHSNPISCQRSHIIIVVIVLPQPRLITLSSLAPSLRKPTYWILTKHIESPDFPESSAEFLDAESVNDGVDSRVAMGKDDGNINKEHRPFTGRAKEFDAVKDVKREPADCEEEKNKGK